MLPPPDTALSPQIDAVTYRRAHAGKLMIFLPADGREPGLSDFFHFESVGTHPTGLFVTGVFAGDRRGHMKVSLVRNASEAEIAWWNSARA